MKFPDRYSILDNNTFKKDDYSIVPIRFEDRFNIMKWRNEQIFHLRQTKPLTEEDQEYYFTAVVSDLFQQDQPDQLLFSYLENNVCIGYGGLVHINWMDRNAEISFIMDTAKENTEFHLHWKLFLGLIEKVAFDELNLHKLYTYAFDLRPNLYQALELAGYNREAILSEHCYFDNGFKDVVIHSKIKRRIAIRKASEDDLMLFYKWANEETTRSMSFNEAPITLDEHTKWFKAQLRSREDLLLVLEVDNIPAGNVRFNREGVIGVSLDKAFRGKNFGVILIEEGIKFMRSNTGLKEITAFIKKENIPSVRVFEKAGFKFDGDAVIKKHECFRYLYKLN